MDDLATAVTYLQGDGVIQNMPEAARLFHLAAVVGSVKTQFNLGVMSMKGCGMPASKLAALGWFALAAARHHCLAQQAIITYFPGSSADVWPVPAFNPNPALQACEQPT